MKTQLKIRDGIALGIGSIMGSGVLFLPSLTYGEAGSDALIAWLATTLLCLPLLLIFKEMVGRIPNEQGVSGWIRLGLGRHMEAAVPLLLLGTVCIGMPSATLIAVRYLTNMLHVDASPLSILGAWVAMSVAILVNQLGLRIGSRVQQLLAFLLFGLGCIIIFATGPTAWRQHTRIAGLAQLAQYASGSVWSLVFVVLFAMAAVQINLVSWTWGLSRMIVGAAKAGIFPEWYLKISDDGIPHRALTALWLAFSIMLGVIGSNPPFMEIGLRVVSTNFVCLYGLCVMAFIRVVEPLGKKLFGMVLMVPVAGALWSSGWLLLYPICIICGSFLLTRARTDLARIADVRA